MTRKRKKKKKKKEQASLVNYKSLMVARHKHPPSQACADMLLQDFFFSLRSFHLRLLQQLHYFVVNILWNPWVWFKVISRLYISTLLKQ